MKFSTDQQRVCTQHLRWYSWTFCGVFSMTFDNLVRRVELLGF